MRKKRKGSVPKLFRKQFGSNCATLCKTILSLVPKSCNCKCRGKCLRCFFGNGDDEVAMMHLVRPDDPPEYRALMLNCIVVVPHNAPLFSPLSSCKRIWSQLQIVQRVIEASSRNDPPNVICQAYPRFTYYSNTNVKVLTNQTWKKVLNRAGDSIMFHLLMHTLILIPTTHNTYQQVAGPPVKQLLPTPPMNIAPDDGRSSMYPERKLKRCNEEISKSEEPASLVPGRYRLAKKRRVEKFEVKPQRKYLPKKRKKKPRRKLRLPSWQRRKICKRLMQQDSSMQEPSRKGADLRPDQVVSLMHSCRCCSVFQSLSSVSKNDQINRSRILYNVSESSSSLFLKSHVFYSSDFGGVKDLLVRIFGLQVSEKHLSSCFHKHGHCSLKSSCLFHTLVELLRVFLQRAKKCQHNNLLEKYCPLQDGNGDFSSTLQVSKMPSVLSSSKQSVNHSTELMPQSLTPTKTRDHKRTEEIQNQFGLSRPYCLENEVVAFVRAVCLCIVPPDLLGSSSSRRTLRRNICRFIKLRRYEKFSLKQCLHKLDVSEFPVFSLSAKSRNIGQMLLERWIFWFFDNIVVPLIQAKFYVTESQHGKLNLFYYRKSCWRKLSDEYTTKMKDQTYRLLDYATVAKILRNRSFGYSRVRLCPKENGARPIANMRAASRFPVYSKRPLKSVNASVRDLHVILKNLKVTEPERCGSTVSSYDDIHRRFCSFLRHLKEGQPTMPVVYIVVADIQKAFDTVDQDMLLSILDDIKMKDTYSFRKSCVTYFTKKKSWTRDLNLIEGNESALTYSIPSIRQKTCQRIINQGQSMTVHWKDLKSILKDHLKKNVLKLGQCFYLQTVGIPQGSVLSDLLCTLYYGHMENNIIFPYLAKSDHDTQILVDNVNACAAVEATPNAFSSSSQYLLLRYVDDILFVSTSKKQASSFFSRLRRGFRKYNCNMNQDKFCMNFEFGGAHKLDSKRLLVTSDGLSFMKWSGLLINCCTLEVLADYSRYLTNHMSSTLSVNWEHRPGRQLKTKLFSYLQPKSHAILFDTKINSPATVRLNVYQAFVVCAMKFHCYVRELSLWCKLQPATCFSSIRKSLRYMYRLMRRRMGRVKCVSDCNHTLHVGEKEVRWLGLIAFIRVLRKKKSRHARLLHLLRNELAATSKVGRSSKLKYAVDDSHSSYLWQIKY